MKRINHSFHQIYPNNKESFKNQHINLVRLFSNLYQYRQNIHFALNINLVTAVEESLSIEDSFSLYFKGLINERINKSTKEIDKLLCLLIDPQHRKFTEEQIGYVDYDFSTLDKESIRSINK